MSKIPVDRGWLDATSLAEGWRRAVEWIEQEALRRQPDGATEWFDILERAKRKTR